MEIDNKTLKLLAKTVVTAGWKPIYWGYVCNYCNCKQDHGKEQHNVDCPVPIAEQILEELKNGTKTAS